MEPDHLDRLKAALSHRYAIQREIGSGGMATVYLAQDLRHRPPRESLTSRSPADPGTVNTPTGTVCARVARRVAALVLLVPLGNCTGCPNGAIDTGEPVDPNPPVASVDIVPDQAHIREGSVFEVRVRLRNSGGDIIGTPPGETLTWEFQPDDGTLTEKLTDPARRRAVLEAQDNLAQPRRTIDVKAKMAGKEGTGVFTILKTGTLASDRVLADHKDSLPIDAALVTGFRNKCFYDTPWALSQMLPLGFINENPNCKKQGQAALFGAGRAVAHTGQLDNPFNWTPTTDVVNASSTHVPGSVPLPRQSDLRVPVRIWILGAPEDHPLIGSMARENPEEASITYRSTRAGIVIDVIGDPIWLGDIYIAGNVCGKAEIILQNAHPELDFDDPTIVHVFYMSEAASADVSRGERCPTGDYKADLIFIFAGAYSPTTLAHEVGHLLGINSATLPLGGHTFDEVDGHITGFGPTNLMWPNDDDEIAHNRDHLSLGQLFRMSFDKESWVNRPKSNVRDDLTGVLACTKEPSTDSPCPRLCRDLSPAVDPSDPGMQCKLVTQN